MKPGCRVSTRSGRGARRNRPSPPEMPPWRATERSASSPSASRVGGRVGQQQVFHPALSQPGSPAGEGHQPLEPVVAVEDLLDQGPAASDLVATDRLLAGPLEHRFAIRPHRIEIDEGEGASTSPKISSSSPMGSRAWLIHWPKARAGFGAFAAYRARNSDIRPLRRSGSCAMKA